MANNSVSPRRVLHSPKPTPQPFSGPESPTFQTEVKSAKSGFDASKFFTKRSEESKKEISMEELESKGKSNKQLLEFVKTVKEKFKQMEQEMETLRGEMTYYQRKSQDQAEVIDDLRKREKYV
jgi:hypothetical protein